MPLFFTPSQADKLLPEVQKTLARIVEIKKGTDELNDLEMTGAMERLQREIQKLEDLGCVLKDVNLGLVDFPAVRLGVRVQLCWKLGEGKVEFWHGLHDGFAGRKSAKEDEFYPDDLAIKALTREASKPTQ
ncbi:MAG: DUF2203 domain-containing protein [Candidatus Bathyarchaeia archaeon]